MSIEKKSQKSIQERSSLLFVDFIKSEKIVLGTISFSLERAPAAGTISNRFFAIICLNNSPHCLFFYPKGDIECIVQPGLAD